MEDTQPQLIPYDRMLEVGMHFGRKRTVFNPGMKDSVHSLRDGICIIDLFKTQEALVKAITLINEVRAQGGIILCVALTKQSEEGILALATRGNMPYVLGRWLGGTLTNFKEISSRVKHLQKLEDEKTSGAWDKHTKKERLTLERECAKMKVRFDGLKKLTRAPDLIILGSLSEGTLAVHEAKCTNVRVIAIGNTDANPAGVEVVIAANDRSKKSVDLILDTITERLEDIPVGSS